MLIELSQSWQVEVAPSVNIEANYPVVAEYEEIAYPDCRTFFH